MNGNVKQLLKKIRLVRWGAGLIKESAGYVRYVRDYQNFNRLNGRGAQRFELLWKDRLPFLLDRTANTGFDRHYVYHPAWAARILAATKPRKHVDISSSLHFVAIASAFVPIDFYDFRPADLSLSQLKCERGDLHHLPFENDSVSSLSCMHVIEHIGLGRYGDPLDPDGDLKAANELKRVLALDGNFLFVTPLGNKQCLRFNGHRIYSMDHVLKLFAPLKLVEFVLIPELSGPPLVNPSREKIESETYACGCFWFVKK